VLVGEIHLYGKFEVKRTSGLDRKIPHRLGSKRPLGNSHKERCISQHSIVYVWMDIRPLKIMIWEKHKAIPQCCNTGNGLSTWQVDACGYESLPVCLPKHVLWGMYALGHVACIVTCRRFKDSSVRDVIGDVPDGRCYSKVHVVGPVRDYRRLRRKLLGVWREKTNKMQQLDVYY